MAPRLLARLLFCAALLVGARAHADEHLPLPGKDMPSLGDRLLDNLDDYSNLVGVRLRSLTFDLVDVRFDLRRSSARVSLGGGDALPVRLDSDIVMQGDGYARVRARLDLELAGSCLSLAIPAVDVAAQDVNGERAVIVRVPILERSF